jgi:hypothetical protein
MSAALLSARATLLWCLALLMVSCTDPYAPAEIISAKRYLVVDGSINCRGVSTFKLTRTFNIAASTPPPTEARATIYLEEEGGPRYLVRETTPGTYTSDPLVLNAARKYRLHITTTGGKLYASDFVPAKITPPIDAITWRTGNDGLDILVNTHDDTNTTQYYRWDYEETWEIAPLVFPSREWLNGTFIPLRVSYPSRCWRDSRSTTINLSKTNNLSQDLVSDYVLRKLPSSTELLYYKYSILVKQYAQTREEYQYWDLLRKNTESIGTLFDPLPSQLTGNVRCLNDEAELALGFVGAHSVEEKRIFITRNQMPSTWPLTTGYEHCVPPDTIKAETVRGDWGSVFDSYYILPLNAVYKRGSLWGYTVATVDCVDCRKRGTDVRPSFWQ